MGPRAPGSALSPYTTLFRSPEQRGGGGARAGERREQRAAADRHQAQTAGHPPEPGIEDVHQAGGDTRAEQELAHQQEQRDRKSTRLNSSHLGTSYAVFCLKK